MSSVFCNKEDVHAREVIQEVNQRLSNVTVSESERPGHAEQISRDALRSGVESILVAAGDATINEVVNGFFEDNQPVGGMPYLGIIPTGDPGDFKRTAGTPGRLTDAISRICSNEPKAIDLGKITTADGKTRYFANVASTGVTAAMEKTTRRTRWLSEIDGDLAFNWSVVKNSLLHKRFPLKITVAGGTTLTWDANCVAICNGQSFGGGIKLARDADMSDGFLDIIVVHDYTKVEFLKGVNQIREDESAGFEGISSIRATSVEISCEDPKRKILIDADNSFAGRLPAKFEIVPNAVNLF
ncbi:MAG: diacylglycerol kinase family protein [Verrucomicrobiales bacterium]|nr:diacylglycerol kinase family protein [Verrucomicrobiales bacterium]